MLGLTGRTNGRSERGAILPLFAIFLPVVVIFAAFVLDVGNWFVHARHLQTQADAAALAGGGVWSFPCNAAAEATITSTARNYGGPDAMNPGALYNAQIGGTPASRLHLLLNSLDYFNQGGSDNSDPAGSPCSAGFLDTKVTESNLPFFIPLAGSVVPAINAHARVMIQPVSALNGLMPLFVRDINPKSAGAIFINDDTHAVLDAQYMDKLPAASCTSGRQCWSSLASPSTIRVKDRTSLVVALSSLLRCDTPGLPAGAPCFQPPAADATVDSVCSANGVECFGEDANANFQTGLVFIRGYSTGGTAGPPNPPLLRDVELAGFPTGGANCPDGYFSYVGSDCTAFIRAKVDVGGFDTNNVQITAFGGNCPAKGCSLSFNSSTGYWQGLFNVGANADPPGEGIKLQWELIKTTLNAPYGTCKNGFGGAGNPCTDFFDKSGTSVNIVQRAYAGQDQFSGPIRSVTVWNDDNSAAPFAGLGANAYISGSQHTLFATVALAGGTATDASDTPVQMRVAGNTSSIDCDPNIATFQQELAQGCGPFYTINTRLSQPDPCNPPYSPPVTSSLFATPNSSDQPWDCVGTQNGATPGPFTKGIQARILGSSAPNCPANTASFVAGRNYWSTDWTGGTFKVDAADPRLVQLFMVPFGAFRSTGNKLFPITNFGAFYVTGWGGNGGAVNNDPCPGADPSVPTGWLSGHFVNYVEPTNNGGGTGEKCDPSSPTPCVAVLVN